MSNSKHVKRELTDSPELTSDELERVSGGNEGAMDGATKQRNLVRKEEQLRQQQQRMM
jgi:hypothetical protein